VRYAILAFVLSAAGGCLAFAPLHAGMPWIWLGLGLVQLPLAIFALIRMRNTGCLREMLQPRWGDISLGVGSALGLYALTWAGRVWITPSGTSREAWLMRVYLQVGDPKMIQNNLTLLGLAILAVSACDELAWRGLVQPALDERFGSRRSWIATGLLYGVSFLPAGWFLRDAIGLNPLVPSAALFGGLVWSLLVARAQRLAPAILSHGLYVWFVVAQFPLFAL
jgi:membrane protease YdiL (CAAX protease family)